ncbi:hypothetical protein RMATCC62417_16574 [Rhizopus microsporus]|nr:hypothetical protein RMATCC62417_16574 [Rhizopus microsporus]
MACMCLAVVGLNLVMILAMKVSRTKKLEIFYYVIIAVSGVLVSVVPRLVPHTSGPLPNEIVASCWYHYYFEGRMRNLFNWLWYYGWLLFSSLFAAMYAIIAIVFIVRARGNYAGALDLQSRKHDTAISSLYILRKHGNTTDVFRKIAIRCICYPLVPLISKIWGVSIEIAVAANAHIPYPVFILDRLFSSLLAFMVSCIYFTDPAICTVLGEIMDTIKRRYVHDYYTVLFQPDPESDGDDVDYPKIIRIAPVRGEGRGEHARISALIEDIKKKLLDDVGSEVDVGGVFSTDDDESINMYAHISRVPSVELQTTKGQRTSSLEKLYDIVTVTSKNGRVYLPNNKFTDNASRSFKSFPQRSRAFIIPLLKLNKSDNGSSDHFNGTPGPSYQRNELGAVESLRPFKHPLTARLLHWLLIHVFRVKPMVVNVPPSTTRISDAANRTKSAVISDASTSKPSENKDSTTIDRSRNLSAISSAASFAPLSVASQDDLLTDNRFATESEIDFQNDTARVSNASPDPSFRHVFNGASELQEKRKCLRRISSINIGSLQRSPEYKDDIALQVLQNSTGPAEESTNSSSSPTVKFSTPMLNPSKLILSMGNRRPSASLIWNKFSRPRSKSFSFEASREIDNADPIELQHVDLKASNEEEQAVIDSDIRKYNRTSATYSEREQLYEPSVREPLPRFPSQLCPRPARQYSKSSIPRAAAREHTESSDSAFGELFLENRAGQREQRLPRASTSEDITDYYYLEDNSDSLNTFQSQSSKAVVIPILSNHSNGAMTIQKPQDWDDMSIDLEYGIPVEWEAVVDEQLKRRISKLSPQI